MGTKYLGAWGEQVAADYLAQRGYMILHTNWRTAACEIDIVAEKAGELAFVEVKTRRSSEFAAPEDAITRDKRRRLRRAAMIYLEEQSPEARDWRIDIIAIEAGTSNEVLRLDHYENAVEGGDFC